MLSQKHIAFPGRFVIIGFGSIGQGVLPLLLRHIDLRPDQITVITAELRGHEVAEEYSVCFVETALTRENYRSVLDVFAHACHLRIPVGATRWSAACQLT